MTETLLRAEKLWGAPSIAAFMGVSVDMVYRLANMKGVPIYRPPGSGRLFAVKSELVAWLKTKPH